MQTVQTPSQLDYLDLQTPFHTPKARHGGFRPGAGRPKGSKSRVTVERELRQKATHELLMEHLLYKEKVSYVDKNGTVRIKRRTRMEILLDMLFRVAMNSPKFSDSLRATREYLDRTMGKPGYMADHYPTERLAREASERNRQEYLAAKEALERPVSQAMIAGAIAYHEACLAELREKLDEKGDITQNRRALS